MPLSVGLAYNLKVDSPCGSPIEDWAAECEESETVERIASALRELGHQVTLFPYRPDLAARLSSERVDIVFNIAEGWAGRNRESIVPAILEFLGISYTGSDPLTLGLALDKALAKRVVATAGVPVVSSYVIADLDQLSRCTIRYPAFVKPNCEGSSKGVRFASRVRNRAELKERVRWVLETYHQPALVEPFLAGREFTVGILGNWSLEILPIMEVIPGEAAAQCDAFVYSYEMKQGNLERFLCPAPVDDVLAQRLREIAAGAYRALGCVDVGRVDIRLDGAGRPFFLELNPLPGLSGASLLPLQAQAGGISLTALVGRILDHALERRHHPQGTRPAAALAAAR